MTGWWREIADLVLPVECAGCGRPRDGQWCGRCARRLAGPGAVRPVRPDPEPPGLPAVWAAGAYRDELRAALLAHKERGALRLAVPLGDALARAARGVTCVAEAVGEVCSGAGGGGAGAGLGRGGGAEAAGGWDRGAGGGGAWQGGGAEGPVVLVPVPSGRRATAARGHDPVRRMALRAAVALRRAGVAARVAPVLRQLRPVADQAELTAAGRAANLAGALGAVRGAERLLAVGPVVLVDDLLTTGASLAEATRAVREAGGAVRGAAVVAAPPETYDMPPPNGDLPGAPVSGEVRGLWGAGAGSGAGDRECAWPAGIRSVWRKGAYPPHGVPDVTREGYVQL